MITTPLPRASPSGTGRLSMIIPRYYGLTITYCRKGGMFHVIVVIFALYKVTIIIILLSH